MTEAFAAGVKAGARVEGRRFARFLVVGAFSFVVETSALSVFALWLGFDRILAKGLAFVLAVISSFLGNYFWAYRDSRGKSVVRQAAQFAAVSVGGLVVNLLVFSTADWLLRDRILSAAASLYVSHMAAVGTTLFWNFTINRLVTYNDIRLGQ